MGVVYEFVCPECGAKEHFKDKDEEHYHYGYSEPGHNKTLMKRVFGLGGIAFKGSGFYKNDR